MDEPLGIQAPPEEEGPVLPRRPVRASAEMDITPMIDITFLLLIFFIVCSTMSRQTAVELPRARHGSGVDPNNAVIITMDQPGGEGDPMVYLGDGTGDNSELLAQDHDTQEARIRDAVEEGFLHDGKTMILIKAGKLVKHGEVARVATAATQVDVENVQLYMGVLETQ